MIKVIDPGFYSTIQDLGRFGFQDYGVPCSGVMDRYSAIMANTLLGNSNNAAVIEMTLKGPKLLFESNTSICISGANMPPVLNGTPIELNSVIKVKKGDILSFGTLRNGVRTYLAVKHGIKSEQIMSSRSMYPNVTTYTRFQKNDIMDIDQTLHVDATHASVKIANTHLDSVHLEVHKGPEFDQLLKDQQETLFSNEFTVAKENNRMAYQLDQTLDNDLLPIITSLVLPGTVQLTPSGKLIVLMRDCQTTGGYPRILQLSEGAINILSQKFTGDKVVFNFLN